jgi:hypothetical protein
LGQELEHFFLSNDIVENIFISVFFPDTVEENAPQFFIFFFEYLNLNKPIANFPLSLANDTLPRLPRKNFRGRRRSRGRSRCWSHFLDYLFDDNRILGLLMHKLLDSIQNLHESLLHCASFLLFLLENGKFDILFQLSNLQELLSEKTLISQVFYRFSKSCLTALME